jgi:hypothetical protein
VLAKLYNAVAIVSIATLLATGALVGVLFGTDRLTPERLETIAEVLRGELDEDSAAEGEDAAMTQPSAEPTAAPSAEQLKEEQRDEQLRRALQERAYRDLRAQRELLDQALAHLISAEERFEESKAEWQAQLKRRRGETRDEGFEKEVEYVTKLPAKQAKKHLVLKWEEHPADAVRLLDALPTSTGKRILEQLETPEELQIMHELLERLGQQSLEPPS